MPIPRLLTAAIIAALTVLAGLTATFANAESGDIRAASKSDRGQDKPLIIAHRGASGYRPEHTLAAYALGARQGADYIEPDLVITKDGELIARHENEIGSTTDVSERPEFADRKKTKIVDGQKVTGWFAEDFTLAEIKTLWARERIPEIRPGNTAYDGYYKIPTFQEVLDLRARLSKELGRTIGVYPETKSPTYFQKLGLPLERPLVRALKENRLNNRRAPVFVQSFEVANLKQLNRQVRVPLVQLKWLGDTQPYDFIESGDKRTYADMSTPKGMRDIARYADAVGPTTDLIVPRKPDGSSAEPTSYVDDAHNAGLQVHPYTFRRENAFLPLELRSSEDPAGLGDLKAQVQQFFDLGVDGIFIDNPDIGALVRDGSATDG